MFPRLTGRKSKHGTIRATEQSSLSSFTKLEILAEMPSDSEHNQKSETEHHQLNNMALGSQIIDEEIEDMQTRVSAVTLNFWKFESISAGQLVWAQIAEYPFWPALVLSKKGVSMDGKH